MDIKLDIPSAEDLERDDFLQIAQSPGNGSHGVQFPIKKQIGFSRPALEVEDLPAPEEAFRVKRVGLEELVLFVLGPGLIGLGFAFNSIEWLLVPLTTTNFGFKGIGWLLLISIILQVFYNIELARFTLATGEAPIAAFGRVPPGVLIWIPLALIFLFATQIWGDWATATGAALFSLITGRMYQPDELSTIRLLGIGLMVVVFFILLLGRKIERTLEAIQGITLIYILLGLLLLALVVVPLNFWVEALVSWVTPAAPPSEITPALLGTLVGFTAMASGLNFIIIGYYRDKGMGMGNKTGYISGLIGGQQSRLSAVGKVFLESEQNTANWKRWFRYLLIDQWLVFFVGILLSLLLPSILVGYLATLPGAEAPEQGAMLVYAALRLGQRYGPIVSSWTLVTGFVVLFSTQVIVLDLLARNLTDAVLGSSQRLNSRIGADPRSFYYPALIALIFIIGILIHLSLPEQWSQIINNLPNLAAMIFPLALIYLNRQLPRPARITWWSYLVLLGNVIFFGYFFINFMRAILPGA
jgi:hypothetical protein